MARSEITSSCATCSADSQVLDKVREAVRSDERSLSDRARERAIGRAIQSRSWEQPAAASSPRFALLAVGALAAAALLGWLWVAPSAEVELSAKSARSAPVEQPALVVVWSRRQVPHVAAVLEEHTGIVRRICIQQVAHGADEPVPLLHQSVMPFRELGEAVAKVLAVDPQRRVQVGAELTEVRAHVIFGEDEHVVAHPGQQRGKQVLLGLVGVGGQSVDEIKYRLSRLQIDSASAQVENQMGSRYSKS